VVLAEVDGVAGSLEWPAHELPVWVNNPNLFDWDVPNGTATGLLTRYFQDASSGNFTVLADYLVPPENYGADIFQVSSASTSAVIAEVNQVWGTTLATAHNFTSVSDFDMWETNTANTGPAQPKTPGMEVAGVYDHVMFIFRSGSWDTGFFVPASPGSLLGHQANTYSVNHAHHGIPIDIVRHELSHALYGGNNFHTGGGGHNSTGEYFITHGNAWSNMGLSGASINSWNAWDRQRMGWKANDQTFAVSARLPNMAEANGDLDVNDPGDAGTYILRDFVTSGDALRIKLPFTNPTTEYPEFLWVENHQGTALNGNPFDKWNYEPDPCIATMVPGLQMYVQIDKEVREDPTPQVRSTRVREITSGPWMPMGTTRSPSTSNPRSTTA